MAAAPPHPPTVHVSEVRHLVVVLVSLRARVGAVVNRK